jgi:hypothetical protein
LLAKHPDYAHYAQNPSVNANADFDSYVRFYALLAIEVQV